jgi:hypothetical protein
MSSQGCLANQALTPNRTAPVRAAWKAVNQPGARSTQASTSHSSASQIE